MEWRNGGTNTFCRACNLLLKLKLELRLPGEITKTSDIQMTLPNGRKWRGTKEPLDEGEKVGLKLNIQKTKFMAFGPITSWQMEKKWKTVADFSFLGSKVTVDCDYSHEIKRCLLLGGKAMTNLFNMTAY